MSDFKVLFMYPNGKLMNPPAISIGLFTALLQQNGFEVDLFDTTLYAERDKIGSDDAKLENLQVRLFSYTDRGVKLKETSMVEDFASKIEEFRPDLIAVSVLESTYPTAVSLLKVAEGFDIPVIVGGVFATFAPEIILSNKSVNMVCIGEGEETLVEVCRKMAAREDYSGVENLWLKNGSRIIKNKMRGLVDINRQPIPDFSIFEQERFLRPMAGKIYKTVPIETDRGVPFSVYIL